MLCIVYVYHVHAEPVEARSGHWILLELELETVVSCHVGAGIEPATLEGQKVTFSN